MNLNKKTVYVPEGGPKIRKKSLIIANALFLELLNFGWDLHPDVFERITKASPEAAKAIAQQLQKEYTVGGLNKPLFNNWEERIFFSFGERRVQLWGYCLQFSGNDLKSGSFQTVLRENVDFSKAKKIKLATPLEVRDFYTKMVNSSVALDRKSSQKILKILRMFKTDLGSLPRIKSAEIRTAALLIFAEDTSLIFALRGLQCEVTDVLRYAAAKKDFESFKLASDVKYANLSWAERRDIFSYLNDVPFEALCEKMGQNRRSWSRFLAHTHFFSQKGYAKRFANFYGSAFVSVGNKLSSAHPVLATALSWFLKKGLVEITDSGNLAYRTFASRFNSALDRGSLKQMEAVIDQNPNYAFRNLTTIFNAFKKKKRNKLVDCLATYVPKIKVGVLFSILQINTKAKYRIIDAKGDTTITEAEYPKKMRDLQKVIKSYLRKKYGFGSVSVSKEVTDQVVPFLAKNTEVGRGTRIRVEVEKYLYLFNHWVQSKKVTDLDLSFVCFDHSWRAGVVNYSRQANDFMKHGGDITNAPAPNGATEYGRIDLKKLPIGARYIAPLVNVYNGGGENFAELAEASVGFFPSNSETFRFDRDLVKYDLKQPARGNVPFIYDVANREIIVLDYNKRDKLSGSVHQYVGELKKLIKATEDSNFISIGDLAKILTDNSKDSVLEIGNGKNKTKPEELFSLFS